MPLGYHSAVIENENTEKYPVYKQNLNGFRRRLNLGPLDLKSPALPSELSCYVYFVCFYLVKWSSHFSECFYSCLCLLIFDIPKWRFVKPFPAKNEKDNQGKAKNKNITYGYES